MSLFFPKLEGEVALILPIWIFFRKTAEPFWDMCKDNGEPFGDLFRANGPPFWDLLKEKRGALFGICLGSRWGAFQGGKPLLVCFP